VLFQEQLVRKYSSSLWYRLQPAFWQVHWNWILVRSGCVLVYQGCIVCARSRFTLDR
jgi:hypothetical protein